MDVMQLRQIFDWLAPTSICELELSSAQTHLRLRRHPPTFDQTIKPEVQPRTPEAFPPVAEQGASLHHAAVLAKAPCVGSFLHRHPLRNADLAPAGSTVSAGQVIGLLQVGALLMPLEAPSDGIVIEHLIKHGSIAGYGTDLIALKPR